MMADACRIWTVAVSASTSCHEDMFQTLVLFSLKPSALGCLVTSNAIDQSCKEEIIPNVCHFFVHAKLEFRFRSFHLVLNGDAR